MLCRFSLAKSLLGRKMISEAMERTTKLLTEHKEVMKKKDIYSSIEHCSIVSNIHKYILAGRDQSCGEAVAKGDLGPL